MIVSGADSDFKQKSELQEIDHVFTRFDIDGDGLIAIREVPLILKSIGQILSEGELKRLIDKSEKDGKVEKEQFTRAVTELLLEDIEAMVSLLFTMFLYLTIWFQVKEAFTRYDEDKDGFLSLAELSKSMEQLGEKLTDAELADMLREAGAEGDGKVSFLKFRAQILKAPDQ